MPRIADVIASRKLLQGFGAGMFRDIGAFSNGVIPSDLGPRKFVPSFAAMGGKFIYCSPTGTGTAGTIGAPVSLATAISQAVAGDRIVMRGGTYSVTTSMLINCNGTALNQIIIEPYQGEVVIISGATVTTGPAANVYLDLTGNFVQMRNILIQQMPSQGLRLIGSDNLLENIITDDCNLSGIHITDPADPTVLVLSSVGQSRNILRSCIMRNSSDVGYTGSGAGEGENADGCSATKGYDNTFEYCLFEGNSDDGLDIWKTIRSVVRYCVFTGNGYGPNGDGNGLKAGSGSFQGDSLVEHCLSFNNKLRDFDANGGLGVRFNRNTAWSTGTSFNPSSDTIMTNNIAPNIATVFGGLGTGVHENNSWQIGTGEPSFKTTKPGSDGFLVPEYENVAYPVYASKLQFRFTKNFNLTRSNPSNKNLRINNTTYASATEIMITDKDRFMVSQTALLLKIASSRIVRIHNNGDRFIVFETNAAAIAETGYVVLTGTVVKSSQVINAATGNTGEFFETEWVFLDF